MNKFLTAADLGDDFVGEVTTQAYGSKASIDGVKLIDLRVGSDDGGSFSELVRIDEQGCVEGIDGFRVRQSSYTLIVPGAIKAFHLHYRQDDLWFVTPQDRLLVGLLDVRRDSPTYGSSVRLAMGGGKPQLLFIPRGVAHGVSNPGQTCGSVIYFVNQQFNLNDPDERRLPYDVLGADFWTIQPG